MRELRACLKKQEHEKNKKTRKTNYAK